MPGAKKRVTRAKPKNSRSVPRNSEKSENLKWKYFFGAFRILIGFMFLWTFFDKLFGFGISTAPGKAWINGVSPVTGFLAHGTSGPFSGIYHAIASSHLVAWLFMLGLLFVGLTMMSGIGLRLGGIVGTVMLFLMWTALLWPSDNPFLDYHWFYAFALITSALLGAGNYIGLGKWWSELNFVKKNPILK